MNVIEELEAERAVLSERLEQIEVLLAEYRQWEGRVTEIIGKGRDRLELQGRSSSLHLPDALQESSISAPVLAASSMEEFEEGVKEVLGTSPTPLDRTKLLQELHQLGVRVGGADERNTLSARMSRLPFTINIKGRGYTLRSRAEEFLFVDESGDDDHGSNDEDVDDVV